MKGREGDMEGEGYERERKDKKRNFDVGEIYECGEDADAGFVTRQAGKVLSATQVVHNAEVVVEDFLQDMNIHITVVHDEMLEAGEFEVWKMINKQDKIR